ncbi:ABC transporter permease [Microbacterium sp. A204]|uniref:ABC transporter permease n=1 Tax=Microbacterium sp. A204 TaxID=3457321 RepID=UPI003FD40240
MTAAPRTIMLQSMQRPKRRRKASLRIWVPIGVIVLITLGAIIIPMLYNYDPLKSDLVSRLKPPGTTLPDGSVAIFGTGQIGADLFAEMMAGARVSLIIGAATLLIAGVIGVLIGLLAGYYGGWLDTVLMRVADIQLAFPAILLAILLASVLGQGVMNVIIVLSISNWVVFARVARSQMMSLKSREYVEAARTLGLSDGHIIFRTLLPGCLPPILVVATVELGHVILAEAALSFLGVGVPLGTPSLGNTISTGTQYLATAWWISTLPGILLVALVLATGILGDAIRDRFDPRLRSA